MRYAVLLCAVIAAPSTVFAQSAQDKADAEALFTAGRTALAAGNFAEACPKLAESEKRVPAIGTSLYLAECYERSGKIASAWAEFREAEDLARQRGDQRASVARSRAERLSPSKLVIVLAPGADVPGLEVRRDAQVISNAQLGLASPIDGGHHAVVAKAPGHHHFEWSGDVPSDKGTVTVTIPKLDPALSEETTPPTTTPTTPTAVPNTTTVAPVQTTPTAEHPSGGGLGGGKIAGLIIAGVGLAAVGTGTALGLVANSNYQSTSSPPDSCNANGCPTTTGVNDRNAAKGLADASTGIFIGGCVAFVAGVVMFLVIPKPKPTSARIGITPLVGMGTGGAVLSGQF